MAGELKVSDELAVKFSTEKDKNTPYVRWVEAQGLDIIPPITCRICAMWS